LAAEATSSETLKTLDATDSSPTRPFMKESARGNPTPGGKEESTDKSQSTVIIAGATVAVACALALLVVGTRMVMKNIHIHRGGLNLVGSPVVSEEMKL
jgi:hypothetical protein